MTLKKRIYSKHEVAVKLFPTSISVEGAKEQMRSSIRNSPTLKKALYPDAANIHKHHFTAKQLRVLLSEFDISEEEFNKLK